MQTRFDGQFDELDRFIESVRKVPDSLVTVNEQLAEETLSLIAECHEYSRDPYGNPWEPLKLREGKPLDDTGGMKTSWHRRWASRGGFAVGNAKSYTKWHQRGTGLFGPYRHRITPKTAKALRLPGGLFRSSVAGTPARKQIPDAGTLPPSWSSRYVDAANEVFTELFNG